MPLFYPPVDFAEPPPIDKAGDHTEFKVLRALQRMDDSWNVFHTGSPDVASRNTASETARST